MRQKTQNFLPGFFQDDSADDETLKIVQQYRNIFKAIHEYFTTRVQVALCGMSCGW